MATIAYGRTFDAARKAQGFLSQDHLDAFFAYYDHTQSCAACRALDGHVLLDDGIQPTEGRCQEARRLDALVSVAATVARMHREHFRTYREVTIERAGLGWMVWLDYVTERWMQPRANSLDAAKAIIRAKS